MDPHKERIKTGCHKILDGMNSMSLVNLDDQQVHSLVMMREIARGVVDDQNRKVTRNDVIRALRRSILKMVCASRDIIRLLSRMSYEGLDDQQMNLLLRMNEIAHRIIDKQPRVAIARPNLLVEQVALLDEGMRDSPVVESSKIGDALIDGAQSMSNDDDMLDVEHVLRFENGMNVAQESLSPSCFQQFLLWPPDNCITLEWVQDMMSTFEHVSQKVLPSAFCNIVPTILVDKLTDAASSILCEEPNCVEVDCEGEDSRVIVVGDIHGQFHDLLSLFKHAGVPSESQFYVFNGNYVGKGAWGIEVLLVLLAWKVLMPHRIYLLCGNHESRYYTGRYGFENEVWTKYGKQGEYVYNKFLECFKVLPLASVIANCVYTTHGGFFRSKHSAPSRKPKHRKTQRVDLGSLAELSEVKRARIGSPYEGPNILLTDILWSKPSKRNGLRENAGRKYGLWWGPDCTEAFLKRHNLKLIIRSHEGPDARAGQDDFGNMMIGYSLDHDVESGKLYTLFSAPDYPQFGQKRYNNEGAYAILQSPDFASPSFFSFKAAERPTVDPYVDSDADEMDLPAPSSSQIASTSAFCASQRPYPGGSRPIFDFSLLGIDNGPSWSVELGDGLGGTQVMQVPRAPVVEGLPLPPNIQEPHRSAYKYLFELVGALKHVVVTRKSSWFSQFQETENRARVSALRSRAKKRKRRKSNS
ncbi:serine/threonine-protein phosphatase 7 isoform X2 [Arachis hypogaea]|uniref:serine/threonine-protein phosphatase 7 isoform X2 n=1 Tax=Arachis hypogaea TaxID=3818 RepID=UPI000DEC0668|nr:serine/threonine-protein phosphatase 7 isoform X1 [Arachis hypogaea]XP_025613677.1 serine/threonine-protein phosphatase 7 isoform X1 [Arachis hypogaea]